MKDRRIKLTQKQRNEIMLLKGKETQMEVAKNFNVSRRTVAFIWYPEKLDRNKKLREERGESYYDKEKHRLVMQRYRHNLKLR